MANPKAGKALQEAKDMRVAQEEIGEHNMNDVYEAMKNFAPPVLRVEMKKKGDGFVLPKYKKKKASIPTAIGSE